MKKLITLFCLLVSHVLITNAQTWDSVGGGFTNYTATDITAIIKYNGKIVAVGWFDSTGKLPVNSIARWSGLSWDSLGDGISSYVVSDGPWGIDVEAVYNNNLYVGGEFNSLLGNMLQWNGTIWDSVGNGAPGDVYALQVYNGKLYAGGAFYPDEPALEAWNGVMWDSVGAGVNGPIFALAVYNGELYAGGNFDSIGNIAAKDIAVWNGVTWSAIGNGFNYRAGSPYPDSNTNGVYALCVYNGKLYAGGYFDSSGTQKVNNIASWDGITWSSVGSGISEKGAVGALTVYGSVLIAGGIFDSAGGIPANKIAQWNGTTWSPLGSGIRGGSQYLQVDALYNDNGTLYVGGEFDSAGGVPAKNIAVWNSPLGVNELKAETGNVKVYPNPNNGNFTMQSSVVSSQWSVEVYNVLGEKVLDESLKQVKGDNPIDLSSQPNGVYLYRVTAESGDLIGQGKLIIQK